ncbi:ejaculatory bulb-specific protein 3-like [Cylas formicarius]|uniref:ejaculatory bulb-specific protein 3-like n=1 Tax=Cylas formicarius TaxID=197179 RepID=UPI002958DA31|nr:ejaculatory bulb-specific protein 3-like [Cylas formicarius]
MNITGMIFVVFLVINLCYGHPYEEKYSAKYDNVDIDAILANERLLRNYIDCLLDLGACTAEEDQLKHWLPDSIETHCSRCTERQQRNAQKIIDYLIHDQPAWWGELSAKYDPEGYYLLQFKETVGVK